MIVSNRRDRLEWDGLARLNDCNKVRHFSSRVSSRCVLAVAESVDHFAGYRVKRAWREKEQGMSIRYCSDLREKGKVYSVASFPCG